MVSDGVCCWRIRERLLKAKPALEAASSGHGSGDVRNCRTSHVLVSHRKCLQRQKAGEENESMWGNLILPQTQQKHPLYPCPPTLYCIAQCVAMPCCGVSAALRGFHLRFTSVAGKGVLLESVQFLLFLFYPVPSSFAACYG